ncbi:MAG TPA: hypothetical protein PLF22_09855 [Pseudomonadales bacterium]|nr:hypothetical protein [Pseudomonadales bacterium]
MRKKAGFLSTHFKNGHIVQIWLGFSEWLITHEKTLKALGPLPNYANILAKIDQSIAADKWINDAVLSSTLTAGDIEKSGLLAEYLIHNGILTSNNIQRREWSEKNRISAMLAETLRYPWSNDISNYLVYLNQVTHKLSLKTQRVYLRAAIELMKYSTCNDAKQLTNNVLEEFLHLQPGYRASLAKFLRFLRKHHTTKINMPPLKKLRATTSPIKEIKTILASLHTAHSAKSKASIVAKLLSVLYSTPLETILRLRVTDIVDNDGIRLNLHGSWIKVDKRVETVVRWLLINRAPSNQSHIFPGKLFGDTQSTDTTKYYFSTQSRV